jgi:hypothetical protein
MRNSSLSLRKLTGVAYKAAYIAAMIARSLRPIILRNASMRLILKAKIITIPKT